MRIETENGAKLKTSCWRQVLEPFYTPTITNQDTLSKEEGADYASEDRFLSTLDPNVSRYKPPSKFAASAVFPASTAVSRPFSGAGGQRPVAMLNGRAPRVEWEGTLRRSQAREYCLEPVVSHEIMA